MALWFFRGVRRGIVTTRYPETPPDAWTHTLGGPPQFRSHALSSTVADALVQACPTGALHRDGAEMVYDLGACTACGRCAALAPDVVQPSREVELAATERAQLIKRIPIRGVDR